MSAVRPDGNGYYGEFGGRFVPEFLVGPLRELEKTWRRISRRRSFRKELDGLLAQYAGRPTPLYHAARLSEQLGGARVFLKREDLLPSGSHRLNSALAHAMLAREMDKERLVAETASGENGIAVATVAARLGLACAVYMGKEDVRRQPLSVERMRLLGARVLSVGAGRGTLDGAVNAAVRDWMTNVRHTHFAVGSSYGPAPYPRIVSECQYVIGAEASRQLRKQAGRAYPDLAVAAVGGGSLAIGLFGAFISDSRVRLVGVEGRGRGNDPGDHAARFRDGTVGVLHGMRTVLLQDDEGQIQQTHSMAPELDYPAVGPPHAELAGRGRAEYTAISDAEALRAAHLLMETEGIVPSLESAHALAEACKHARELAANKIVLVAISGSGDKDAAVLLAGAEGGEGEDLDGYPAVAVDWGDDAGAMASLLPGQLEVLEIYDEPPTGMSAEPGDDGDE